MAAFVSFAVGTIALAIYLLVSRKFAFSTEIVSQTPWWIWIGGLLGTLYVVGIVILAPRLGVGLAIGLTIAGQLVAAMILDHYGWMGLVKEITLGRVIGALLLIAGLILIRRY